MRIPSGVTDQYVYFIALDATDLKTRETGLSAFTVYRSRNGDAPAPFTTPTINETDSVNMPGVYELLLDEDMTIDAGDDSQEMIFHITHAGMAPTDRTIELYRPKITAGSTSTAQTGDSFAIVNGASGLVAVKGDTTAILVDTGTTLDGRIPAALTADGNMKSDALRINGSSVAAVNLARSARAIVTATIGAASTTTNIVTSALSPAAAAIDQFKGRILIFDDTTTTANLRGQATDITASTALGVLTVTALTDAPVNGDTGTIV